MDFTAIITAFNREEQTCETIRQLQNLSPPPTEIIVHFDNGASFPLPKGVRAIHSPENLGPGGARNRLIEAAQHEFIASFDDDSYPVQKDFLTLAAKELKDHPDAAVIACEVQHRDEKIDQLSTLKIGDSASFIGCGCLYRRSLVSKLSGYLPLPVAYGMEEVDLSLQIWNAGLRVIQTSKLKVFHDSGLTHHENCCITAGSVANQALLAYCRYPAQKWFIGLNQYLNKIFDSLKRGRVKGSLTGIILTPIIIWKHRNYRSPVSPKTLDFVRSLRSKKR